MALFKPTFALESVLEITPDSLKAQGIKALILDIDNTLTTHDNPVPAEGVPEWISDMKKHGIKLIAVSNNRAKRVVPFARLLKLRFVPNGVKPLPMGILRAVKRLGLKKSEICIVGDQIFTDILGANLSGIRSVLVNPIEPEKSRFFKIKRAVEKPLRPKRYNRFN